MKKRLLYYNLAKQIYHKNTLVITGMRQVGKTTLMKQIFEGLSEVKKIWFDFDNPLDQKVFEDIEYRNIFKRLSQMINIKNKQEKIYVFIDEIQNFPEITKIIKYLIDHFSIKFIVTGSSNFYLKNLFPESLSGRKFLYHLPPLNFREFLYFKDLIKKDSALDNSFDKILSKKNDLILCKKYEPFYEEYLRFGGFPEVVTTDDQETKQQVLKNIFASFFEKDLRILSDYKDIRVLRDLILLLTPRVGSMLDVSKIASELGIDRPKIYDLLEFLQGTFFIKLLPRFSRSIDRAVAGGKKVYFTDTGMLNTLGSLTEAQILENAVVNQMNSYGDLSFYNQRNISEIDLILEKKIAIEVKIKGLEKDLQKTKKIAQRLGIDKSFVISKQFVDHPKIISSVFL